MLMKRIFCHATLLSGSEVKSSEIHLIGESPLIWLVRARRAVYECDRKTDFPFKKMKMTMISLQLF